jgi:hypothetical protein
LWLKRPLNKKERALKTKIVVAQKAACVGTDTSIEFDCLHRKSLFTQEIIIYTGKRGLWLKVPIACGHLVGAARDLSFEFHHAKPHYVNKKFDLLICK